MKKGKLLVIEGTDCSGKETQSSLLLKNLKALNIPCHKFSFPWYDSPTGKIIAGPYLAKPQYGVDGYFPEGASNVPPEVASLYFSADRKYNIDKITSLLDAGENVILDRYIESNMAHQAGKYTDWKSKKKMIRFLEALEYRLLKLPRPDLTIFLHMPTEVSSILKAGRDELPDQHECNTAHLKMAEQTYIYLSKRYGFKKVKCNDGRQPRKIEDIQTDVFNIVKKFLKK